MHPNGDQPTLPIHTALNDQAFAKRSEWLEVAAGIQQLSARLAVLGAEIVPSLETDPTLSAKHQAERQALVVMRLELEHEFAAIKAELFDL